MPPICAFKWFSSSQLKKCGTIIGSHGILFTCKKKCLQYFTLWHLHKCMYLVGSTKNKKKRKESLAVAELCMWQEKITICLSKKKEFFLLWMMIMHNNNFHTSIHDDEREGLEENAYKKKYSFSPFFPSRAHPLNSTRANTSRCNKKCLSLSE